MHKWNSFFKNYSFTYGLYFSQRCSNTFLYSSVTTLFFINTTFSLLPNMALPDQLNDPVITLTPSDMANLWCMKKLVAFVLTSIPEKYAQYRANEYFIFTTRNMDSDLN